MKRATSAAYASFVSITRPEAPIEETVADLLLPLFPHAADNPRARAGLEVIGQVFGKILHFKFPES